MIGLITEYPDILINEPDMIEEIFVDLLHQCFMAKHAEMDKPIFISAIPKQFLSLFSRNLIKIKSWHINSETQELSLGIMLSNIDDIRKEIMYGRRN